MKLRDCCSEAPEEIPFVELYRQARSFADDELVDVWLPVSQTPNNGPFKFFDPVSETCYYLNYADAPSDEPGNVLAAWTQVDDESNQLCLGANVQGTGQDTIPGDGCPVDLRWDADAGTGYMPARVIGDPAWYQPPVGRSWLSGNCARTGSATYRTTLTLNSLPAAVHLDGRITVDNHLADVLVNGVSLGIEMADVDFTALHEITLEESLQSLFYLGENTIEFVVVDTGAISGIFFEEGDISFSGPVSIHIAGTGQERNGSNRDTNWSVDTGDGYSAAGMTTPPFVTYFHARHGRSWITDHPTGSLPPFFTGAPGTFKLTFTITNKTGKVHIPLRIWGYSEVEDILVNGDSIGVSVPFPGPDLAPETMIEDPEVGDDIFVEGVNTIEFEGENLNLMYVEVGAITMD